MSTKTSSYTTSIRYDSKISELMDSSSKYLDEKKDKPVNFSETMNRARSITKTLYKPGVHSVGVMSASGLHYTGISDTARCDSCGLEVSNWTLDMKPLNIHAERSPHCTVVQALKSQNNIASTPSSIVTTTIVRNTSVASEQENPSKRQKIESTDFTSSSNTLFETNLLQHVRRRSFSHWPHRTIPSTAQMVEAGFFNCNVGDRVICIYCDLICQQWTPHTDDPVEVHKTLSPNCIYVKAKLMRPTASSIVIVNENSSATPSTSQASSLDPLRSNEIVFTAACNPAYTEIPRRHASFVTWPNENLPSVDDLVRAGFFYTGTKTIVTCFYCNGSLQNWGPNDNPMIEHARWFPHCAYAKQLCGDDLYRKIQESKRAQQERARMNDSKEKGTVSQISSSNIIPTPRQLLIPDESTLSRLVAARLDLPISQRLLDQDFKLSIIKRCWEDQLRIKQDDFATECDLYIACLILKKQIERIDGKKENIVIPSIKMSEIRERNARPREQPTTTTTTTTTMSQSNDAEMTSSQSLTNESQSSQSSIDSSSKPTTPGSQGDIKANKPATSSGNDQEQTTPSNPCVLCLAEEKRLACIPCGHLATCVPCGHSLRSCPICRREIEAFVRIYI